MHRTIERVRALASISLNRLVARFATNTETKSNEGYDFQEGESIMSKVRHTVGAFLVAAVVASGIILTPASARAEDLTGYCSLLAQSIEYLENLPNPPQGLLARLHGLYDTYCVQ
jgi:hypothetical protein